jgi:hypothetical protein
MLLYLISNCDTAVSTYQEIDHTNPLLKLRILMDSVNTYIRSRRIDTDSSSMADTTKQQQGEETASTTVHKDKGGAVELVTVMQK